MDATKISSQQNVFIIDRNKITVTGIRSVDSFNDENIVSTTVDGSVLSIEGTGLLIKDVNLENNQFEAVGLVSGLFYVEDSPTSKRPIFGFLKRK